MRKFAPTETITQGPSIEAAVDDVDDRRDVDGAIDEVGRAQRAGLNSMNSDTPVDGEDPSFGTHFSQRIPQERHDSSVGEIHVDDDRIEGGLIWQKRRPCAVAHFVLPRELIPQRQSTLGFRMNYEERPTHRTRLLIF